MNRSFTKDDWLVVSTALEQMLALGIIVSDRVLPRDTHFLILYLGVQARSVLNGL
jgi:hypothetical protein